MGDQTSLKNRVAELEAQMSRIMESLGQPPDPLPVALFPQVATLQTQVASLQGSVGELPGFFEGKVKSVSEDVSIIIDAIDIKFEGVKTELGVLKRAVGREEDRAPSSKVKVLDPKPFGGARSAKELENFLWDMEMYFQAVRIPDAEKMSITSMYLTGDAKLWWRTRLSDDASANREKIEMWDVLKKELKDQFLPCNTSWLAMESLRKLRHSGTVRDYVKEFSSLMLDVWDMPEEDKLFNFLSGLQAWAQTELRRQGVKDLPSAIAAG